MPRTISVTNIRPEAVQLSKERDEDGNLVFRIAAMYKLVDSNGRDITSKAIEVTDKIPSAIVTDLSKKYDALFDKVKKWECDEE